jgi:hypothetical protein
MAPLGRGERGGWHRAAPLAVGVSPRRWAVACTATRPLTDAQRAQAEAAVAVAVADRLTGRDNTHVEH